MAGLVQFNRFYIEHGIRNIGQMMTLRKNDITQFTYPLNTTLHFGVREIGEIGLPQEDELFTNAGTRILTNYINQYSRSANVGAPIKVQRLFIKEVKDFLKQNKRFKYIEHSRSWLDVPAVPFIVNYSSVDRTYKYRQREGVDYWRRLNFFSTIVDGVVEQLDKTQRNQFMYFDIPDFLPGLNRLEEAEKNLLKAEDRELPLERRLRNFFNSDGRHIVLEFWLWAGENRHLSVFSKIPEDKLDRVTFMTSLDGRYNVLNLGVFDKWIRDEQNNNGALTYQRAQRVILRHFMAIQQIRSVSDDTIIVDSASELEKSDAEKTLGIKIDEGRLSDLIENDNEYLSELPADPLLEVNIDARDFQKGKTLDIRTKAKVTAEDPINGKLSDAEDFLFDQMERDLQQHTVTSAQIEVDQLIDSESVYRAYEPEERRLDTKINKVADQLAAKGLLSSAEVRRVKGLGVRYQRIKSPFDPEQTIEEYMEINPESLLIKEDTRLTEKNIRGVLDDSMMHYSIQDFDSRYISEIMGKDIVNAFMHFQHAGVAVTDVNISRTDEYLGSYQTISLQLTPVIGKPSTVRLKIPVIDRDGIFVANGVKYRMKKQRVDKNPYTI